MKRRKIEWFFNYKWYKGDPFKLFDITVGEALLGEGWMIVDLQIGKLSLGIGFWWRTE